MRLRALLLESPPAFRARVAELDDASLPAGEVLVQVHHSSLNYKDALAIARGAPVVRAWPMVPGIDLAGVVAASSAAQMPVGAAVLANGWGLGETRWGGLAQAARVPAAWLQAIPAPFDTFAAAALGTAGYTAALCVLALLRHGLTPAHGAVLVSGASGGVGSVAVMLLARLGFEVTALTGKADASDYLRGLGAHTVLPRTGFEAPGKPLQDETFAAAVDTLGSQVLANICARTRREGAVAVCGLAQGMDFPASMAPFILRGVSLFGIDSVHAAPARREAAWALLAEQVPAAALPGLTRTIALPQAIDAAHELLAGRVTGRLVVDVNAD